MLHSAEDLGEQRGKGLSHAARQRQALFLEGGAARRRASSYIPFSVATAADAVTSLVGDREGRSHFLGVSFCPDAPELPQLAPKFPYMSPPPLFLRWNILQI